MMDTFGMTVGQRGVITLPKAIRERYRLAPGAGLTLHDLDGLLIVRPADSRINELAQSISNKLAGHGESLESMLSVLREERARYGKK